MGRKPTVNLGLPPGVRVRRRGEKVYFFYDVGGKPRREIALGTNRIDALRKWAELDAAPVPVAHRPTIQDAIDRYRREVLPSKAAKTQRENLAQIERLVKFFCDPRPAPLEEMQPLHVRQYLDWRGDAPVSANREKALLSHVWNKAREWGYTDRTNICEGITGYTETGRADKLPSEDVIAAVSDAADQTLRDAIALAFLTGQRPADVLSMTLGQVRDGELWIRQAKTGAPLRITIEGELAALLARLATRRTRTTLALLVDEAGQGVTRGMLRSRFDKARKSAAKAAEKTAAVEKGINRQSAVDLAQAIRDFQFRDLRAAAGTEVANKRGKDEAQALLGHSSVTTTERYVRARAGSLARPTR